METEPTAETPKVFTEKEAATYLGMSIGFLRQARMRTKYSRRLWGPPFIKMGRAVRYRPEDLEAYLRARRVDFDEKHLGEG